MGASGSYTLASLLPIGRRGRRAPHLAPLHRSHTDALINASDPRFEGKALGPRNVGISLGFAILKQWRLRNLERARAYVRVSRHKRRAAEAART